MLKKIFLLQVSGGQNHFEIVYSVFSKWPASWLPGCAFSSTLEMSQEVTQDHLYPPEQRQEQPQFLAARQASSPARANLTSQCVDTDELRAALTPARDGHGIVLQRGRLQANWWEVQTISRTSHVDGKSPFVPEKCPQRARKWDNDDKLSSLNVLNRDSTSL